MLKKLYLLFYNLVCCAGWAYIFSLGTQSLLNKDTPSTFWKKVGDVLTLVQSLAILEIFHSALRIVKSPLFSTLSQVSSRLLLVWAYTRNFSSAQAHWTLYLMVLSWAAVEVPRYLFYFFNLIQEDVIFPIFWLRYNLFAVLYPTGISGEVGQMLVSLPLMLQQGSLGVLFWYTTLLVLLVYVPGGPFMYGHMIKQKSRAFAKRNAPKSSTPAPLVGIQYPLDKKGERGTTPTNKGAWLASVKDVDEQEAKSIEKVRNWRFGYAKHVVNNVRISAKSRDTCLKVASAGLKFLHGNFEFFRNGEKTSLAEAMNKYKGTFETGFIKGEKKKPENFDYEIPYGDNILKGDDVLKQLNKWVEYGTIEPDCGKAIENAVKNKKWIDLSDRHFVLLGAGSAMGPILVLLSLGAHVIAVDLDRDFIWKRLIGLVKDSCGSMTFPLKKPQKDIKDDEDLYKNAGCNLFTDTPEICNWVKSVYPEKQLIIGGYAYLDGALFLKVSIAMDAIMEKVCEARKNTAVAFLCSPTDCFFIPDEAYDAMNKRYKSAPLWQKLISSLTGLLKKNALKKADSEDGKSFAICDGVVNAQGPNYALAKRLQHWRCMLLRESGHLVSTNVAPSTATKSVVSNKSFAAAYGGMHHFKPMEVMYQETSNAVMGALLINDLNNPDSVANPKNKLDSPLQLFARGSFHGGIWRMAYKMDTIGVFSALAHYINLYKVYLFLFGALEAGVVAYVYQNGLPHQWFLRK